MRFVAIADHPPEACPASNAKVQEVAQQSLGRMEELGKKYGVRLETGSVLAPSHKTLMILEAENIEDVNRFLWESTFSQWNDISVFEAISFQEAMKLTEEMAMPPIW